MSEHPKSKLASGFFIAANPGLLELQQPLICGCRKLPQLVFAACLSTTGLLALERGAETDLLWEAAYYIRVCYSRLQYIIVYYGTLQLASVVGLPFAERAALPEALASLESLAQA